MPLWITEYAYLAKDVDGKVSDVPADPGINHTPYAITTASRSSATLNSRTRFVRIAANTASVVAIGPSADATSRGSLIAANVAGEIFGVDSQASPVVSFKMFVS